MRGKVFGTLGFRYLGGSGTQGLSTLRGVDYRGAGCRGGGYLGSGSVLGKVPRQ